MGVLEQRSLAVPLVIYYYYGLFFMISYNSILLTDLIIVLKVHEKTAIINMQKFLKTQHGETVGGDLHISLDYKGLPKFI